MKNLKSVMCIFLFSVKSFAQIQTFVLDFTDPNRDSFEVLLENTGFSKPFGDKDVDPDKSCLLDKKIESVRLEMSVKWLENTDLITGKVFLEGRDAPICSTRQIKADKLVIGRKSQKLVGDCFTANNLMIGTVSVDYNNSWQDKVEVPEQIVHWKDGISAASLLGDLKLANTFNDDWLFEFSDSPIILERDPRKVIFDNIAFHCGVKSDDTIVQHYTQLSAEIYISYFHGSYGVDSWSKRRNSSRKMFLINDLDNRVEYLQKYVSDLEKLLTEFLGWKNPNIQDSPTLLEYINGIKQAKYHSSPTNLSDADAKSHLHYITLMRVNKFLKLMDKNIDWTHDEYAAAVERFGPNKIKESYDKLEEINALFKSWHEKLQQYIEASHVR